MWQRGRIICTFGNYGKFNLCYGTFVPNEAAKLFWETSLMFIFMNKAESQRSAEFTIALFETTKMGTMDIEEINEMIRKNPK